MVEYGKIICRFTTKDVYVNLLRHVAISNINVSECVCMSVLWKSLQI